MFMHFLRCNASLSAKDNWVNSQLIINLFTSTRRGEEFAFLIEFPFVYSKALNAKRVFKNGGLHSVVGEWVGLNFSFQALRNYLFLEKLRIVDQS